VILEKLTVEQADKLMIHLKFNDESNSRLRRCRVGAHWFHKNVIFALYSAEWSIGRAIGVVAMSRFKLHYVVMSLSVNLDAPRSASRYDTITCSQNVDAIVEALKTKEGPSMGVEYIGWAFFGFLRH
jgi:hypothetical protein